MNLNELLKEMVLKGAMDIFIITGRPISCKINRKIEDFTSERLNPANVEALIKEIYSMANRDTSVLYSRGDDDFSFAIKGVSRFRMNAYKQRGSLAAVIRVVPFNLPSPEKFGIPDEVLKLAENKRGLVLITGLAGSGKTTTLACILDRINKNKNTHIVTLEDPIEYLHPHDKSIISQREISLDTQNYPNALRAALRQSPDVILIGELRDSDTITTALTAAETGHYILSALHTLGAANSIDRLVDTFSASQQEQIRMQLSMALQTVVCQQLLPGVDGTMVPAFEIMHCNSAIRTLIRDGRTHQINSMIQSSGSSGMVSMDMSILRLLKEGKISEQTAYSYSLSPQLLQRQIEKNS